MFRRADNARVASKGAMGGWDQMRARMLGEDGSPLIYCLHQLHRFSIRTIPMLQHDEKPDPKTLIPTWKTMRATIGAMPACRAPMSGNCMPKVPTPPKFLHETSLDELWETSKGQGNRKRI